MKGKKEEANPLKKEDFSICGPAHLTSVDWRSLEHKGAVAASLIQGVFVLERDRQEKRTLNDALAPIWWDFFHFHCFQTLVDPIDSSIFGIIYQYKYHISNQFCPMSPQVVPPKYVIAFRGTITRHETGKRDLHLDLKLAFNGLTRDLRYQMALQAIESIIANEGPGNVWLTGHSLGAAIALQAGKDLAKRGCYIETYLFNPPYICVPIEKINDPNLKLGARIARSVLNVGLSLAINGTKKNTKIDQHDPFSTLCCWTPYLFLNPKDPICCEYIGYFEHREKMEGWGVGGVERIATKTSVLSLVSAALGRDGEAVHLIPSAFITKNVIVKEQDFMAAHGLLQWWEPHPYWHSKLYQLNIH
ncbi:GDSL esterase/lipase At4g10955-like [Amaranthus tricolor]|uniref:GDSL esterase/lipase At4g10955-like n=1 Tax=Amaranthus tricolor TaxID=29722 RepID=UPI0025835D1D|nr:GDSL esterase/lipase At4g10955-like [Amaranthus tricolor]